MVLSWWPREIALAFRRDRRRAPQARRQTALILERLEDRTVPSFLAPKDLYVGEGPEGVVTADFTGDGVPDLVAVNGYTPANGAGVVLLRGNGDGNFQPPVQLAGGRHAALVTADFNGDGQPDLAFTNLAVTGATVSVLLGNGDGTFQPAGDFAGDLPSLAAADLNGDGVIDLVNDSRVFLGNGDGTFQLASQLPGTGLHVAVADVNHDDKPDLVAPLSEAGVVLVYPGNGDGTFQSPLSFGIPLSGRDAVAVGDFNGDGNLDVTLTGTNRVRILLGNGDGTFRTGQSLTTPASTTSLAATDLNADGVLDLVAGGNVLLGNGDGTFQAPQEYFVGDYTSDVTVADFNGDGVPDFVTANVGGATLNVRLNSGDGTFIRAPRYGQANTPYFDTATTDVNGDGSLDLVTTGGVLLGNGDGTFQDPVPFGGLTGQAIGVAVLAGDRLAVGRRDGVSILVHASGASFQVVANYAVPGGTISGFMLRMAVADLNGDGVEDLVTTDQRGVNVLLGNPDGTFRLASRPRTGYFYASSVAAADFDGDGIPDLAVGHGDIIDGYGVRRVVVFRGNGDGTFQGPVEYELGSGGETPIDVAAVDLNGDGTPDLAVLDAWGGKVVLMMNQGDGTFTIGPSLRITGGLEATSLVVSDFNNDGIPDLAAVGDNGVGILLGHGDNGVGILPGHGGGTFDTMLHYGATGLPLAVAAGDFNGDGFTDLAAAGEHGGIAILLNAGDWSSGGGFPGGDGPPGRLGGPESLPGSTAEPVRILPQGGTSAGSRQADPAYPEENGRPAGPAGRAPELLPQRKVGEKRPLAGSGDLEQHLEDPPTDGDLSAIL
jgi:hypothetical protein